MMKRYQIVYSKGGFRAAGYSVDVWEHTEEGARKTDI